MRERLLKYIKSLIQFTVVSNNKLVLEILKEKIPFADITMQYINDSESMLIIKLENEYQYHMLYEPRNKAFWLKDIK